MQPNISEERERAPDAKAQISLGALVLSRIASSGGATRTEVVRDLAPLVAHRLSPAEWRRAAEAEAGELVRGKLVTEKRGRLAATEAGITEADMFLGFKGAARCDWADMRDLRLIAKALGVEDGSAARQKSLARPEGLRALILTHGYGLQKKSNPTTAWLRAQLALVALERAFGNTLKSGLGSGDGLAPKVGRLLAGHLSGRPRDFGTDQRLIVTLAAEKVDAVQPDLDGLRAAILRQLGSRALDARSGVKPVAAAQQLELPKLRVVTSEPVAPVAARPAAPVQLASVRPDLRQFARAVNAAAASRADGWVGNRKAFISHVWAAIRARQPEWAISEIEFKCMLAEAHRAGEVVLANADLIDKKHLKEFQDSALPYKNTVWHFVRVED